MAKVYMGFAVADSMFQNTDAVINRIALDAVGTGSFKEAIEAAGDALIVCANPSHKPTFKALKDRFGIDIAPPAEAISIEMEPGDMLFVASIRGLPRLDASRHEYTEEEVKRASFAFSVWEVLGE